ncbi:MAG: hypothetical protein IT298_09210 [Chloroflexi bacterium]|jgi:hypothetical protein|nr:hypothetical protein [Chloroflexota bacterium]MBV6437908.1 hypothetical protein [Anaerolineae bacterium]MDL1916952.1 hypothetical protein [Anaerolineae bacterium CFX4]OQY84617.1 MAG: hypothetical protein B6D42_04940 [Anaerolineae bacterium UTCFX5]MCC6565926.1 hypothetical protein [Chloroflexota bacterium]
MANGFSRSPVLLKGALIRFDAPLLIPIPNIIIFQYNPESLSRTLTIYDPSSASGGSSGSGETTATTEASSASGRAQPTDPQESFTLRLILDASDALESPAAHPVAFVSGVADRIAALEMLLYPITEGVQLLGSIGGALSGAASGAAASLTGGAASPSGSEIPPRTVPVTLFVWGPGRIVPVRVTSFSVDEQSFSPMLYPVRASVSVGLTILHPSVFQRTTGAGDATTNIPLKPEEELAVAAYKFTMVQKQVLATANLLNSVESIINMLPI